MGIKKWVETKKECELDEKGEYIVKKVTLELVSKKIFGLSQKDFFDLFIRILGLTAIFIPILLFYLSRNSELRKQKSLLQFEIHSNIMVELQNLLDKSPTSNEFKQTQSKLFLELSPKLVLLNDTSIIYKFSEIKKQITQYSAAYNKVGQYDSLIFYRKLTVSTKLPFIDSMGILTYANQKFTQLYLEFEHNLGFMGYSDLDKELKLDSFYFSTGYKKLNCSDICHEFRNNLYFLTHFYNSIFMSNKENISEERKKEMANEIKESKIDKIFELLRDIQKNIVDSSVNKFKTQVSSLDSLMKASNIDLLGK